MKTSRFTETQIIAILKEADSGRGCEYRGEEYRGDVAPPLSMHFHP